MSKQPKKKESGRKLAQPETTQTVISIQPLPSKSIESQPPNSKSAEGKPTKNGPADGKNINIGSSGHSSQEPVEQNFAAL